MQHFNTREDIKILLNYLDGEIVDENSVDLFDSNDYLSRSDLSSISQKNNLDMDEILVLITSDIWFSPTPYRSDSKLLSNGSAHPYDREKNIILDDTTFADCAEMALRHISNLLFYNKMTR